MTEHQSATGTPLIKLSDVDRCILELLSGNDGYATGPIARAVSRSVRQFGHNSRIHSAWVRLQLLDLQRNALVEALDDKKPVIWKRTELGTQKLKSEQL
jgi:hypothetical protein